MSASGQRWHPDSEAVNAVAAVSPEWRFMVEFSYHDVTPQGQPVERNEESCRSYARVHLSSTDRQELYLEVVRFHDLKPEEEYLQHRRYLEQRLFTRFSDVTNEILEARIWAGIHFRNADVQAAELGRDVARYIPHALLRSRALRRDAWSGLGPLQRICVSAPRPRAGSTGRRYLTTTVSVSVFGSPRVTSLAPRGFGRSLR